MSDSKLTNPKDFFASKKLDLSVVPHSAIVALAEAFTEGAIKYGRFNWRVAGVRATIYVAAEARHVAKWYNGQRKDPVTRVHHLKNAMACLAILLDAEMYNMLNDDRPPCPDPDAMARAIDEAEEQVAHLKELFKDHSPIQYTQAWVDDTRSQAAVASKPNKTRRVRKRKGER